MLMKTLRSQMRWIMIAIAVLFVISVFGMYGFEGARKGRAPEGSEGGDYVVAEIDGKSLLRSTLDRSVRDLVGRMDVRDIKPEDIPRLYRAALDGIVTNQRLAVEAKESGLDATDAEIDQAIREVSDQFPTKEAFMQYLDQSGVKMAELRESIAAQIVQGKVVERASEGLEATEEEALDFYEKMKELLFHSPAGFKVDYARFKDEAAAVRAVEAIKLGGEWKEVVGAVASDDLITSTLDTGPVFMADSSFKDKLGLLAPLGLESVGGPAKMEDGDFFVGIKREKIEESTVAFEEVGDDVKAIILEEKKRMSVETFFRELRDGATVVVHDLELFHVPEPPAEAEDEAAPEETAGLESPAAGEGVEESDSPAPEEEKEEE
ncbi:MAG: hypothetical protein GX181_04700 [Synergistaceae bacterium]|nr:hypothetical protein [Synergistaceae bacterium]